MSRTALVVLSIVALTLGAVFFIIRQPRGAQPSPTLNLVGSALDPIPPDAEGWTADIRIPGRADVALVPVEGERRAWLLRRGPIAWPVSPDKAASLLRLIDDAAYQDQAEPGADPIRVEITASDGETVTLDIATTPLSGRVALESSNGLTAGASPQLLTLLLEPGPESWRISNPFPGFAPANAARLEIVAPGDATPRAIELARLDGRWRVIRPVAARANPVVVDRVLSLLGEYRIDAFLDSPDSAAPAPGDAALEISIERRAPGSDADRRTLHLFAPSGAGIGALIDGPQEAPVRLAGPAPTAFSTAVRSYLATTPTDVLPENVGAIRLRGPDGTERMLERSLDRWVETPGERPVDAGPIDEALAFLSREPGEPQESFSETDVRALAHVELLGFDDGTLERLSIGYNADGFLTVRGHNVVWLYGRDRGPALFDLPAFGSLDQPRDDTPATEPEGGFPQK